MKMQSVEDLLYVGMTYAQDFEKQIGQEAQKMAQASSNPDLKDAFEKTVTKSNEYAERIQSAFGKLGKQPSSNSNGIAKAMIEEVENIIANSDQGPVRDAALIVAANQQQQYRVAVYGSLHQYAGLLGKDDAVADLQKSLQEAKNGDEKFTSIGENQVNREAAQVAAAA